MSLSKKLKGTCVTSQDIHNITGTDITVSKQRRDDGSKYYVVNIYIDQQYVENILQSNITLYIDEDNWDPDLFAFTEIEDKT